eukprot:9489818-Pyramimonas_sp.AAC.3
MLTTFDCCIQVSRDPLLSLNVQVGKVDCIQEKTIGEKYNIESFPTILHFPKKARPVVRPRQCQSPVPSWIEGFALRVAIYMLIRSGRNFGAYYRYGVVGVRNCKHHFQGDKPRWGPYLNSPT